MAISDTLTAIKQNLQAAYNKLQDKGATIPTNKNMENLAGTIETVSTGTDTSDATATASDILAGKTAYVDGDKVTGTIETNGWGTGSWEQVTDMIIPAGTYIFNEVLDFSMLTDYYSSIYEIKIKYTFSHTQPTSGTVNQSAFQHLANTDDDFNYWVSVQGYGYRNGKWVYIDYDEELFIPDDTIRTITVLEAATVPNDVYNWFMANTVKKGG